LPSTEASSHLIANNQLLMQQKMPRQSRHLFSFKTTAGFMASSAPATSGCSSIEKEITWHVT
jgi:hypothetical protein